MLFEYAKVINGEFSVLSIEFFSHILLLLFVGVIFALIGYRVKGILGSIIFTFAGAAAFLYQYGILRF
jgi:hypothetical protein